MDGWPVPFASAAAATAFLGHEAWARGLEERVDGWYPRFDPDVVVDTVADLAARAYWDQWARTRCPTLLVRGASGTMNPAEAAGMRARRPDVREVVVPGAAHDVHLDQPGRLHEEIAEFLAERRDA
ncbi:alpha/beta hydrolase [Streptomyces sp. NPDC047072]|uniref:alpha/beta fold hydrolase n=1 Tax=Streptomyces sp. NPDC047072 TaxID=3154809 RepID=UPI0033F0EAF5